MLCPSRLLLIVLICLSSSLLIRAEDGVLLIQTIDTQGAPISGVILSVGGDYQMSPPTDAAGTTRIKLPQHIRPGDEIDLQIIRAQQDLVFISPWHGRVVVRSFDNKPSNIITLVLAERRNRALLEGARSQAIPNANTRAAENVTEEKLADADRKRAIEIVAASYNLKPEEVDRALRSWVKKKAGKRIR